MRKKMLVAVISESTVLVSGCIDSEKVTELHIKDTCNETDSLCSVELVEKITWVGDVSVPASNSQLGGMVLICVILILAQTMKIQVVLYLLKAVIVLV